jgi:hypothetical protein
MGYPLLFAAKRRAGLTRVEGQRLSWAQSLTRRRAAVRMFRLAAADCEKHQRVGIRQRRALKVLAAQP